MLSVSNTASTHTKTTVLSSNTADETNAAPQPQQRVQSKAPTTSQLQQKRSYRTESHEALARVVAFGELGERAAAGGKTQIIESYKCSECKSVKLL